MNDFTKEEIQYIFDNVDNNIECFNEPAIAYKIRHKLKSMIDNYCEHEFYTFLKLPDGSPFIDKCFYCDYVTINKHK